MDEKTALCALSDFITENTKNRDSAWIIGFLESIKMQALIQNYKILERNEKSIRFVVQPFFPVLPQCGYSVILPTADHAGEP